MPSGYYILARYFLRLDKVMCMLNDARYHYEVENDYVLRECIARSEECDKMKFVSYLHASSMLVYITRTIVKHI